MTTEQVGQVFEPFFTARKGGKGLGMTLTKNIIRSHNGDIQIQSTLNEGTTFTIILPFNNPLT